MSFSVSLASRTFEWASGGLNALFATRSNLLSPSFRTMIADMQRFNADAPAFVKRVAQGDVEASKLTMGDFLAQNSYSTAFRDWYLVPQVAAVWSASTEDVLAFPAHTFLQFCVNHSLAQVLDRPVWRTVSRRSREYVRRIAASLPPSRSSIKLSNPVSRVARAVDAATGRVTVTVTDASGASAEYDQVIFGCHPDQALAMLGPDASEAERSALSGFRYQANVSYLHTDATLMPARRSCWSAWNYIGKGREGLTDDAAEPCCVSYYLNVLQNLGGKAEGVPDYFVTLNPDPAHRPAADKTIATFDYSHPQYTHTSIQAQKDLDALQGTRGLWFCGAYLGYGFHEDGVTSGLRVAARLTGVTPSWWDKAYYSVRGKAAADSAADADSAPTPLALLAEIKAKKASGSPYWEDNLGNGGPVGTATRETMKLVKRARAAAATAAAAAAAARGTSSSAAAAAAPTLYPSSSGAPTGTSIEGDITGFLLHSADDVLHAYRAHVGAGRPALLGGGPLASSSASSLNDASSVEGGGSDSGSQGGDKDETVDAASTIESVSIDARSGTIAPPTPTRRATAAAWKAKRLLASDAPPRTGTDASVLAAVAAATGLRPRVLQSLLSKRVFKSGAVGDALAAALREAAAAANPSSSSSSAARFPAFTVGHLMTRPGLTGGYTGQERPLQTPEAYSGAFRYLLESLKGLVRSTVAAPVLAFLRSSIIDGCILLRGPDGNETVFGNPSAAFPLRARIRVHSWNFFSRVAAESDLGLARSFIAGEWSTDDLTALFNVFIANRDNSKMSTASMWTAWIGDTINYLSFAIQMDNSIAGSRKNIGAHYDLSNDLFSAFLDTRTMMYSCAFFETERRVVREVDITGSGGAAGAADAASGAAGLRCTLAQAEQVALNSIPVHPRPYSEDCIRANAAVVAAGKKVQRVVKTPYVFPPRPSVLAKAPALVAASAAAAATAAAAAAAAPAAPTSVELVFKSTLEEAQLRKLDHLIARANVQKTDRVLDLGFGWGGLSIRLAETVGCRVVGITLSKEQHDLALERVRARGLDHLITFEIVDYRVFAAAHPGEFDRIISVEMIEAVGANYFGEYMAALDRLLAPQGLIVIQAITMPESRYETYIHTTDFINTIIFPGGCCPSLAAVTGAMMKGTNLLLTSVDQFNVHYGETLRRWRANFNAVLADVVRPLGFDDAFIRTWNYYLCYCEAGFSTQTLGLQVLTFMRPNTQAVIVGRPAGRLAEPIGPFVNDDDAPVLVPAGTW
jgi:uncharacterized protein